MRKGNHTYMNKNQRKRKLSKNLTIALSLLVAAAICVTIIAFTAAKRSKPSEKSSSSVSTSQTTTKATSQTTKKPDVTPTDDPASTVPTKLLCPVAGGVLSKDFSDDIPVWSTTMEDYRVHLGIDIEADAGEAVLACADGEITDVYVDPMMGQTIIVKHSDTCKSVYKNLRTKLPEGISVGKKVSAGDTIGYVGDTALVEISDMPHLHFEFHSDAAAVNPLTFFSVPEKNAETNYED